MRVSLPSLPLQVAATPWPPTVKMLLLVPLVSPLTGPSKVSVSERVSPTLLPPLPASVVAETAGAVAPSVGGVVSTTGSGVLSMSGMAPAWTKALPTVSWIPPTSAVFNASSSIVTCPPWPAWMV